LLFHFTDKQILLADCHDKYDKASEKQPKGNSVSVIFHIDYVNAKVIEGYSDNIGKNGNDMSKIFFNFQIGFEPQVLHVFEKFSCTNNIFGDLPKIINLQNISHQKDTEA
jgi:hypothetical protein